LDRQKLKSTLEIATNIAVLLLAVVALSTLTITFFLNPATPKLRPGLEKGKAFGQVSKVDYRSSEQTLLIALNTNCSYCRESLPLYRKLEEVQHEGNKSTRILALFPNSEEEVARYTEANQLKLDTVANVDFRPLLISGTPTMVLVNKSGEVKNFWLGKLADPEEDEFLRSLIAENRRSP